VDIMESYSKAAAGAYYHYQGSLTTPPCSETVHWYVLATPMPVTAQMIKTFKALFPSPMNNRPVQSLNGRTVLDSDIALLGEFKKSGARHLSRIAMWTVVTILGSLSM